MKATAKITSPTNFYSTEYFWTILDPFWDIFVNFFPPQKNSGNGLLLLMTHHKKVTTKNKRKRTTKTKKDELG